MTKYNLGQYGPNVFLFDESGKKLIRKFWFYPSGLVTYREWDEVGNLLTHGERQLLPAIQSVEESK